jgi:cardiolipin synthase
MRCEAGNWLDLMSSGEEYIPAMLLCIENAREAIDLELYRVDPGPLWKQFFGSLADAVRRRVRVRLLVDSFGSRRMLDEHWQAVRQAGIIVQMTPSVMRSLLESWPTRRDHRKLLVVDGEIAFSGGMSIDDTFFRPHNEPAWRESMVRVRGPVVSAMQRAFDESWGDDGVVVKSSVPWPSTAKANGCKARLILSTPARPRGESLFLSAISEARSSVSITNPFVVPSVKISEAVVNAARNGVDVRLLVPGRFHRFAWVRDAMRGFYAQFLGAGVRVFEYEAAMLHAKTIAVDERWASVGSFNLDARSFVFNDEVAVAACDSEFARAVATAFAADCEDAREVTLQRWRQRGLRPRFREAGVRLLRNYL